MLNPEASKKENIPIWVREFAQGILRLCDSHCALCIFGNDRHPFTCFDRAVIVYSASGEKATSSVFVKRMYVTRHLDIRKNHGNLLPFDGPGWILQDERMRMPVARAKKRQST